MRLILLFLSIITLNTLYAQKFNRYTSHQNHFIDPYFFKDTKVKFDKEGVIKQKGIYNALKSSVFGIYCYDKFIETKDSVYFYRFMNQYKFLGNEKSFDYFDNKNAISYPYKYNHSDLKATWYSGLTSGVIASYFLRYYKVTGDKNAFILAKKNVNFMLLPLKDGGVLSFDKENLPWIEEYPNSKNYLHVTNGFIASIVALHEYLQFENDKYVDTIYKGCIKSLKKAFKTHELKDNTCYSLGSKAAVKNYYLKLQINQLCHLYELTDDEEIFRQSIIWKMHSYTKTITFKRPGYINKYYDFAVPFKLVNDSIQMNLKRHKAHLPLADNYNKSLPEYTFYDTIFKVEDDAERILIKLKAKPKRKCYVFYKSKNTEAETHSAIWNNKKSAQAKRRKIKIPAKKGFLKVRVVVETNNEIPGKLDFKLVQK